MMNRGLFVILFLFLPVLFVAAQKKKPVRISKSDKEIIAGLQNHIRFLADDRLEGRRTGTPGEKLAGEYISSEFQKIGLQPKGTSGYWQAFEVNEGRQINPSTFFMINDELLGTGEDFFPFPWSPDTSLEALPAISVREAGMPWFYDLKEALEENRSNPHFDLVEYIRTNAKKAKEKGASAIILYNTSPVGDPLTFNSKDRSEVLDIPVLYVSKKAAEKYFSDESATLDIKLKIDIGDKIRTGHNIVGYLENNAPYTVVLGAHYDHLGYGEDGNSMLRTGEKLIHNGADDNASGTAALIELARMLKSSSVKNSNFLFIAFSGEELGLFGSKYFADSPTIDLKRVNYMINMDMIGRLNDSTRTLTVGGFGTSPQWSSVIRIPDKKNPLVIKIDSSGTGPSDHTSFYRKDLPVLFFFTGLHPDYHKPGDDADKINYTGQLQILQYIYRVILSAGEQNQKLVFTKTRETQTGTAARFSVSLGVMPDYTYSGSGVRIDGVSEGRAAQKAGMKAGDIIIRLGDHPIGSLENYMQALGKFKKGDNTRVQFRRGNETLEADVQF